MKRLRWCVGLLAAAALGVAVQSGHGLRAAVDEPAVAVLYPADGCVGKGGRSGMLACRRQPGRRNGRERGF